MELIEKLKIGVSWSDLNGHELAQVRRMIKDGKVKQINSGPKRTVFNKIKGTKTEKPNKNERFFSYVLVQ